MNILKNLEINFGNSIKNILIGSSHSQSQYALLTQPYYTESNYKTYIKCRSKPILRLTTKKSSQNNQKRQSSQ